MLKVTDTCFKDLGDSRWWYRMLKHILPCEDVDFVDDALCQIYDPNITPHTNNRGLEIIKDGSVMDIMPSDAKVLLSTVQEPICVTGSYPWHENVDVPMHIRTGCDRLGLDHRRFAYASGDCRVGDRDSHGIRTFFVPGWNYQFWRHEGMIRAGVDLHQRTHDRVFLSFNRYLKSHRYYFITRCYQESLLSGNLVSCPLAISGMDFAECGHDMEFKWRHHGHDVDPHGLLDWPRLHASARELTHSLPLVLDVRDFEHNNCFEEDTLISSMPFYQRSFMNVITESSAHGPGCYPSEAIFRPIVFQQPFLTIAQPGLLALLRSWGFDTFDDLFDNSYDHEPCQYMRTEKVIGNIKRLANLSPAQLRAITIDLSPRLAANMEHYFSEDFKRLTLGYVRKAYNWFNED